MVVHPLIKPNGLLNPLYMYGVVGCKLNVDQGNNLCFLVRPLNKQGLQVVPAVGQQMIFTKVGREVLRELPLISGQRYVGKCST